MSHKPNNITPPTTNTSIRYNFEYLLTIPGLLKLGEFILGAVSVGCAGSEFLLRNFAKFFLLMATTFMVGTFCVLLSCIISWRGSKLITGTNFYFIYHAVATILLFAASVTFVANNKNFIGPDYNVFMAASVIGTINSLLYFASTNFAYMGLAGVQTGDQNSTTSTTKTATFERHLGK